MLLPLLAILAGLAVSPLTTSEVANDARSIVDVLDLDDMKIAIRELRGSEHPSPLLVKHSKANCTIFVNTGNRAHVTWGAYIGEAEGTTEAALRDFAVAHEIGHCILADARQASVGLPELQASRSARVIAAPIISRDAEASMAGPASDKKPTAKMYDEVMSDLIGLRFVQLAHPGEFDNVRKRIRDVRREFAASDPEHDSSEFLTEANLAKVARLIHEHDAM